MIMFCFRPDVRLFLNLDKNMPEIDDPESPTDENSNITQVWYNLLAEALPPPPHHLQTQTLTRTGTWATLYVCSPRRTWGHRQAHSTPYKSLLSTWNFCCFIIRLECHNLCYKTAPKKIHIPHLDWVIFTLHIRHSSRGHGIFNRDVVSLIQHDHRRNLESEFTPMCF